MDTAEQMLDLCHRWAAAELAGDAAALDRLATDDFQLVGPAGFVLDRDQWLDRFGPDKLQLSRLDWHEDSVRSYPEAAIAIGVQDQQASYAGNPADGRFRTVHVAVRQQGELRLASIQFSPLGGPGPFAGRPASAPPQTNQP